MFSYRKLSCKETQYERLSTDLLNFLSNLKRTVVRAYVFKVHICCGTRSPNVFNSIFGGIYTNLPNMEEVNAIDVIAPTYLA